MNKSSLVFTGVLALGFVGCAAQPPASEEPAGERVDAMVLPKGVAANIDLTRAGTRDLARADLTRMQNVPGSGAETRVAPESAAITEAASGSHPITNARSPRALVVSEPHPELELTDPPPVGRPCGGIAGNPCPGNLYCDVYLTGSCGGADLTGVCKPVPEVCNDVYDPVCGCDGVTYSNDCRRLMAGVQIDHDGECTGSIPCGPNVCGEGQYCCNESCGICVPRGAMCIQKVCE